MTNDVRTATDPLGNTIHILQGICLTNVENDTELYDDAATVIMKPAILFEVDEDKQKQMFYYRSVGWGRTMLIKVHFHDNRWESVECIINPSNEMLSDIMKIGRQLL